MTPQSVEEMAPYGHFDCIAGYPDTGNWSSPGMRAGIEGGKKSIFLLDSLGELR
jgi:hypothetical protein